MRDEAISNQQSVMFVLIRAVTYAALFICFVFEQDPRGLSVLVGACHVGV